MNRLLKLTRAIILNTTKFWSHMWNAFSRIMIFVIRALFSFAAGRRTETERKREREMCGHIWWWWNQQKYFMNAISVARTSTQTIQFFFSLFYFQFQLLLLIIFIKWIIDRPVNEYQPISQLAANSIFDFSIIVIWVQLSHYFLVSLLPNIGIQMENIIWWCF